MKPPRLTSRICKRDNQMMLFLHAVLDEQFLSSVDYGELVALADKVADRIATKITPLLYESIKKQILSDKRYKSEIRKKIKALLKKKLT